MKKILLTILFAGITAILGYFTYQNLMDKNYGVAITLFIITVVSFSAALLFLFMFLNRNSAEKMSSLETRLKRWTNISYHVSQAGDEAFNKLPIGIALYDETYEIKWANEYAKKIFNNNLIDQTLDIISKELLKNVQDNVSSMKINFNNNFYEVVHNVENDVLYFFDVTQREEIISRYDSRITVIGIVGLDNLEESLKKFDMQEKREKRDTAVAAKMNIQT